MRCKPVDYYGATRVYSRDGAMVGEIISATRRCQLEGCTGRRIGVRWPNGERTYPCSKGMKVREDNQLQIL